MRAKKAQFTLFPASCYCLLAEPLPLQAEFEACSRWVYLRHLLAQPGWLTADKQGRHLRLWGHPADLSAAFRCRALFRPVHFQCSWPAAVHLRLAAPGDGLGSGRRAHRAKETEASIALPVGYYSKPGGLAGCPRWFTALPAGNGIGLFIDKALGGCDGLAAPWRCYSYHQHSWHPGRPLIQAVSRPSLRARSVPQSDRGTAARPI